MTPDSSPADAPIRPQRFFINGDPSAALRDPRVVTRAVIFNLDIREGDREFSAQAAAHQIPLLKKKYGFLNGTVTVTKAWVTGLDRVVTLNQQQFLDEMTYLQDAFRLKTESNLIDFMVELYGATKREQTVGVLKSMNAAYKAWRELEDALLDRARKQLPTHLVGMSVAELRPLAHGEMTDRELQSVIDAADPSGGVSGDLEAVNLESLILDNALDKADGVKPEAEAERPKGKKAGKSKSLPPVTDPDSDPIFAYFTAGGMPVEALPELVALVESGEKISMDMLMPLPLTDEQRTLALKLIKGAPTAQPVG